MMLELKHAIEDLDYTTVQKLINKGVGLNEIIPPDPKDNPYERRKTSLEVVFGDNFDIKMLHLLINNKANVNMLNDYKKSVIESIILKIQYEEDEIQVNKYFESIKYLIEKGLDINYQNDQGETVLLYAVNNYGFFSSKETFVNLCKLLLDNGIDPGIKDVNGMSPLNCENKKLEEIIKTIYSDNKNM